MANWSEKFNKVTQSAITKSKEMVEVTRLNTEISSLGQNLKELYRKVGEYVLENGLLKEDEVIADLANQASAIRQNIKSDQEKMLELKNIVICPNCGAEMSRDSRFCDKCGTEIIKNSVESQTTVCPVCGSPMEKDAMFCGNCGSKRQ